MTTKDKTIKFISVVLITLMLLPSVLFSIPKQTEAVGPGSTAAIAVPTSDIPQETAGWLSQALHVVTSGSTVTNTATNLWGKAQKILERILMTIAKSILAKMTQATINWINSDFHGSPLFIENPESFFKDIAKSEVRRLVDMIGYDTFRFPFGPQTALNVISSYKRQLADNAQYTLSTVINDPDLLVRYRNDFNYGGWNGFLINTQYPQNNYLGFQGIIQQNLASHLEGTLVAPAQKIQNLLQQGMGFLSPQTCPTNSNYNNGTNEFLQPSFNESKYVKEHPFDPSTGAAGSLAWSEAKNEAEYEWEIDNTCPGGLVNTTPGSVAGNQIMTALSSNYRQSELAAALGNSLSAILDALIGHFMDKGLNALAGTISPSASADNWSYNGNTFSGSNTITTSTNIATSLDIPQNVSVSVGQGTSTNIRGGKAPYYVNQSADSKAKVVAAIDTSGSSGPKLVITARNTPTTTPAIVTVFDSSTPSKTAVINVTVNEIGALLANGVNHVLDLPIDMNQSKSVTISGGQGNYSMQTGSDETKAIAVFTDASLVIIGIAPGSTYVEIKDSSSPAKVVRINILIGGRQDLIVQQNISASIGQAVSVPISGGVPPYSISIEMNTAVANARIEGNNLIVTGLLKDQQTAIIIQDSSTPPKNVSVNISTKPFVPLVVNPQSVSTGTTQTVNVPITGGVLPYIIQTQPDATIANAQILSATPTSLTITGVKSGNTQVAVQDSSTTNLQTFLVNIIVNDLSVTPASVIVSGGFGGGWRNGNATITGGSGGYSIQTPPNAAVATARISGSSLIITAGGTPGSTLVVVRDSSTTHTQTFIVNITSN
ncbi:MAG: hypothetical protein NTZ87_03715 [Candidatus Nomurabacteria bacterium]|nr:hypothetical protein [Candidatus Nomurabacteria bacterium]